MHACEVLDLGCSARLGLSLHRTPLGLQRGIIGPALFSILVLMAIITTLMASPLFEWVYGRKARARGELGGLSESDSDMPGIKERQRA